VAIVTGAPTDTVELADVTVATLVGEEPGAELGLSIHTGDLDGDGHADVLAGAPISSSVSCVYGASTPWSGELEGADADWQFCGRGWLGYDFALGDFDGDGATDLAAGAPAAGTDPGAVHVWTNPRRGRHEADDAALVFGSGLDTPDLFGFRVAAGDMDGDGRDDLAIGAPSHPELGEHAGAVAIVFGGGL
jgi:hypothetical protein